MNKNFLKNVIAFVFKYIWIFCAILILFEFVSVFYTASILIERSSPVAMQSVTGEISGRVDGVLRLLTGISQDQRFADTSKPLYDRVIQLRPYKDSYNLFMIALTDEDANVMSSGVTDKTKPLKNLAYRDYMQRLYATGVTEITDVIVAGADGTTLNYTIAVPLFKDEKVAGSVFGSIYFDDIEEIITRSGADSSLDLFLLGTGNTVMAASGEGYFGKAFSEMAKTTRFIDCNLETVENKMQEGKPGSCWEWGPKGLAYITYQQVAPTGWTLLYRTRFSSVLLSLVPVLCIKIGFFILLCSLIYLFGRRYLTRSLAQVNHLVNRMAVMQKELFRSEQSDYDNLLEITEKGLSDQLTGLSTRAVLFEKMTQRMEAPNANGAVIFLDLDDLKRINDNFGHDGGDLALIKFGLILKEYEQKYDGLASRYGGDEFIFVCHNMNEKEASELAQNLCRDLNITVTSAAHSFSVHASLGISFYPSNGSSPEELICKADLALYSAKQHGKNQFAVFSPDD